MDYKLRCDECGATAWAIGHDELDLNVTVLDDVDDLYWSGGCEDCEHDQYTIAERMFDNPRDEYDPHDTPEWESSDARMS